MTSERIDRVDHDRDGTKPRVIAFYLPQFHPTPENDTWWPRGFTEWRNVVRASPLFPGHQQPHVPSELGFYDLRVPEVRVLQAELARGYGIEGFCYYHYWFKGRRVLQRPFQEVLTSGEPDFPFCLAWANENWTRAWDAGPQEVLIEQTYDPEDDRRHIDYLIRAFKDPRYIRVDGRPLLLIYRVQGMPDPVRTFDLWRERARAAGIDDLYIVKFDTHGNFESPEGFGADAAAEFVPHGVYEHVRQHHVRDSHRGNALFRYIDVAGFFSRRPSPDWKRFPCVMPGWDNSPRRPDGGVLADRRQRSRVVRVVALERGRPGESRRPAEPARLRERVERMGRGLSPRTRRALRTRRSSKRRRTSSAVRDGPCTNRGTRALRRSPSSISTSTRNSWSCSTPIPSSSRRSDAASTRPSAT